MPKIGNAIVFLGNGITDIGEWAELWQDLRVKKLLEEAGYCCGGPTKK